MRTLVLALCLALAGPALAASRQVCERRCTVAIRTCRRTGQSVRLCRQQIHEACRRDGPQTCFRAEGRWRFTGRMVLNDCQANMPSLVTSIITIVQSGSALTGTLGQLEGSGTFDAASREWELISEPSCDATCCSLAGVKAFAFGSPSPGALVLAAGCVDGSSCAVGYEGTLRRRRP